MEVAGKLTNIQMELEADQSDANMLTLKCAAMLIIW